MRDIEEEGEIKGKTEKGCDSMSKGEENKETQKKG